MTTTSRSPVQRKLSQNFHERGRLKPRAELRSIRRCDSAGVCIDNQSWNNTSFQGGDAVARLCEKAGKHRTSQSNTMEQVTLRQWRDSDLDALRGDEPRSGSHALLSRTEKSRRNQGVNGTTALINRAARLGFLGG